MRYEKSLFELGLDYRKYLYVGDQLWGLSRKEVVKLAHSIDDELADIFGGQTQWRGRIFIKRKSESPDAWGVKTWTCDIWLRSDCSVHVLVHELLHGRSYGVTEKDYSDFKGLEEGVVEQLARILAPRIQSIKSLYSGHNYSYQKYVDALEEIRIKYAKRDEMAYYHNLFQTPLRDRKDLLLAWSGLDKSSWTAEKYRFYHLLGQLGVKR
jgi:hypothetical protein